MDGGNQATDSHTILGVMLSESTDTLISADQFAQHR